MVPDVISLPSGWSGYHINTTLCSSFSSSGQRLDACDLLSSDRTDMMEFAAWFRMSLKPVKQTLLGLSGTTLKKVASRCVSPQLILSSAPGVRVMEAKGGGRGRPCVNILLVVLDDHVETF